MATDCNTLPTVEDLQNAATDAETIAEVATSRDADGNFIEETKTRLGDTIKTLEGALEALGFITVGEFGQTFTINQRKEIALDSSTGNYYQWTLSLPKNVTPADAPTDPGWSPVTDAALRQDLESNSGADIVGTNSGNTVQDELDSKATQTALNNETAARENHTVVNSQTEIAALDSADIDSIASDEEGKSWNISTSVNGLENTPDIIKMGDGRFANRQGGFKAQRLGAYKTSPDLNHRAGDFMYVKYSQTHAKLISDLSRFKPLTKDHVGMNGITVAYVDWTKGNDNTGDGLSWENAKASLDAAEALGTDIILVRAGVYDRVNRLNSFPVTKDRAFIGVGGKVIAGIIAKGTWSKTPGTTNVYQLDYTNSGNSTVGVFDKAILGDDLQPANYSSRTSIVAVDATPGTFYHSGDTTYIHALRSRDLVLYGDELVLTQAAIAQPTITFEGNFKLYFENFEFWGGQGGALTLQSNSNNGYERATVWFKNGFFGGMRDGGQSGGLQCRDVGICITEDCINSGSRRDGYNYHNYAQGQSGIIGLAPHFIEINNQAHGNGDGGTEGNNQGSTAHENCVGFRIGSDYSNHPDGGCVVDIQGVRSYNVCCFTKNSSKVGALLSADGYDPGTGVERGKAWFDGHYAAGNPVVANGQGDIAMDGQRADIHMQDTDTEKPISTRTFSTVPDEDFS